MEAQRMMDVVLAAYVLEELIIREGGPRLVMLPFVKKAIEMLLHNDKDKAMEYLKLAREAERLYQEVPDWYEAVMKWRWDHDSHGLNCDDEYDGFKEGHEKGEKLGRDETFTFKRDDDDYDDTHDLGLDDSKRECIIDGESECHEKNEGYVDKRLCTFCGYCQGPSLTKENWTREEKKERKWIYFIMMENIQEQELWYLPKTSVEPEWF